MSNLTALLLAAGFFVVAAISMQVAIREERRQDANRSLRALRWLVASTGRLLGASLRLKSSTRSDAELKAAAGFLGTVLSGAAFVAAAVPFFGG